MIVMILILTVIAALTRSSTGTSRPAKIAVVKGHQQPSWPFMPSSTATPITVADESAKQKNAIREALAATSAELSPLLVYSPELKALHDRLRVEGRDEAWAMRSEAMLHKEFDKIAKSAGSTLPPSIQCGTTLCEVQARFSGTDHAADTGLQAGLQQPELAARLWGQGYRGMNTLFGPGASGTDIYTIYYQREAPVTIKVERLPAGGPAPR